MAEQFHYPPEVFNLLVDTIPLLCRSKKDVITFFQGAGVDSSDLKNSNIAVQTNRQAITKYEIVRDVLIKVNARGDNGLHARREIIKRVVEFEEFSTCWSDDQLKALGLVVSLREVVNVKDSFTRIKQERETERARIVAQNRAAQAAAAKKRKAIEDINKRLCSLFSLDDKPQERGKVLEATLNDLFRAYEILIQEDFRRKAPDSSLVLEQIDGVIMLNGTIHLVEMKWLKEPVGVAEIGPHLVRLYGRANASGIFISNSAYTEAAIQQCREALNQRTIFLCSLHEIVMLLRRQADFEFMLKRKSQAAILDKNPYSEILDQYCPATL
jgi:restriction endonuclease Mrr